MSINTIEDSKSSKETLGDMACVLAFCIFGCLILMLIFAIAVFLYFGKFLEAIILLAVGLMLLYFLAKAIVKIGCCIFGLKK